MTRKLIRPSLDGARREVSNAPRRKALPPESTQAEARYLQQAVEARCPMVVRLLDGTELTGRLESFDRNCLELALPGRPAVLLRKEQVKLYRADFNDGTDASDAGAAS
ncbi:MAG: hypothetical protein AAF533_16655 [Acidobacteriota bacterium]